MIGKLPTYVPGETEILAKDMNIIARAAEMGTALVGTHGIAVHQIQGGQIVRLENPPPFWAKIKGNRSDGSHAWIEMNRMRGGIFAELCDARHSGPDGISGSSSSSNSDDDCGTRGTTFVRPAYEANGKTAADGTMVRMHFGFQNEYLFVLAGEGTGADRCTHILFEIKSANCLNKTATVRILQTNCFCPDLLDCEVEVVDRMGCVFDEPNTDLAGRKGVAVRMTRTFQCSSSTSSSSSSSGEAPPCEWMALALCCFDGSC